MTTEPLENARHEAFVQYIIAGKSQRQAYLAAFPAAKRCKPANVDSKACTLFADAKIRARYNDLMQAAASDAVMSRQERMETLSEFARSEDAFPKTRMQAIDLLNKMDGSYIQKIEATVTGDLSETAARVGAILDE